MTITPHDVLADLHERVLICSDLHAPGLDGRCTECGTRRRCRTRAAAHVEDVAGAALAILDAHLPVYSWHDRRWVCRTCIRDEGRVWPCRTASTMLRGFRYCDREHSGMWTPFPSSTACLLPAGHTGEHCHGDRPPRPGGNAHLARVWQYRFCARYRINPTAAAA